ncbi:MAG: transposase, partial [Thermoguttaceae bacterium]
GDNPYDGHTLDLSISGAEKLTKVSVLEVDVDRGYRGHDYNGVATIRLAGGSNRGLTPSERKRKRRRSAIEPIIGHLKSGHRLGRCFLKGRVGDAMNLIGSAAGFNVRKLLRLLGRGIFSHALESIGRIWTNADIVQQIATRFCEATFRFFTHRRSILRPM